MKSLSAEIHQSLNFAAERLIEKVQLILANESDKEKCQNILCNLIAKANLRAKKYEENKDKPYSSLLWAYLSLHTKGRSNDIEDWSEKFEEIYDLLSIDLLELQDKNSKQIIIHFAWVNYIFKKYAPGRYMTISKDKNKNFYNWEFDNFEYFKNNVLNGTIQLPDSLSEVSGSSSFNFFQSVLNKEHKYLLFSDRNDDLKIMLKSLKTINGISEKYSSNILMDLYPLFTRDKIAIDVRIYNILGSDNQTLKSYNFEEYSFVEKTLIESIVDKLCHIKLQYKGRPFEGSITLWEVDRLLYTLSGMKAIDWINLK